MRQYIILFSLLFFVCTSCNRKANTNDVGLPKSEEKSLVALGQLWGFLKYHHPAVANGDYDWDAELIKMIPLVCKAKNDSIWKKRLDNWLDSLPPVPENPNKKLPDLEIKTKPDYGELFSEEYFYPKTIEKIKYILNNAVVTSNHYVKVDMKQQYGLAFITNEPSYKEMLYPELPYRLLALFRYWNIVNYFFPYRELCDQKWSTVLADMLPDFINAKNQKEYIFACMKLVTKIDDSHAFLYPDLMRGLLYVPFEVQFVEGKLVVTMFTGSDTFVKEKIKIGDIITTIEGEPVDTIVKSMWNYTPASNDAVKLREISAKILTGNSSTVTIAVQRDGKTFKIKIPRYDLRLLNIPDHYNPYPEKEGYTTIGNNIGYMLPSSCKVEERDDGIKKVLDGTKGVIIDLRCYPSDYMSLSFIDYLKEKRTRYFFSQVSPSNVSYPGYFFVPEEFRETVVAPNYRYTPKIVVVVNEYTQSQAEDHVLGYQTAPNVTVIGSTSAGADGKVVYINLPGNISTRMTGLGVYYPDGSNLQRAGVKIDEVVKPTIAGIKAGRDELLERAIEIINESNH